MENHSEQQGGGGIKPPMMSVLFTLIRGSLFVDWLLEKAHGKSHSGFCDEPTALWLIPHVHFRRLLTPHPYRSPFGQTSAAPPFYSCFSVWEALNLYPSRGSIHMQGIVLSNKKAPCKCRVQCIRVLCPGHLCSGKVESAQFIFLFQKAIYAPQFYVVSGSHHRMVNCPRQVSVETSQGRKTSLPWWTDKQLPDVHNSPSPLITIPMRIAPVGASWVCPWTHISLKRK